MIRRIGMFLISFSFLFLAVAGCGDSSNAPKLKGTVPADIKPADETGPKSKTTTKTFTPQ
jgi:hypothetical protein